MRKEIIFIMLLATLSSATAQKVLTLEECRDLALRNNKQLGVAGMKKEVAGNLRKAARTKYLPKVDAVGGYEFFSREISILSNDQKTAFSQLGTSMMTNMGGSISSALVGLAQQGAITPDFAKQLGTVVTQLSEPLAQAGNQLGQKINDALRTDTRNVWAGAIVLRQPIYMGGAITAANRMADINEQLVSNQQDGVRQNTLAHIDEVYWTVISLKQKQRLASSYRDLVQKLDDDVQKMIKEGVATRSTGLQVAVKVNEADMQVTQASDGVALAKMLLCQLCGLPLNEDITLADEGKDVLPHSVSVEDLGNKAAFENRSELKMLENAVELSEQGTKLVRAAYLPQVALTGGYMLSNPSVLNGNSRECGTWA